ncbi:MAG: hypothetical protein SPI30_06410 [Prevotella sp.]|nr:hypothetical protein [Prevotella sp.]
MEDKIAALCLCRMNVLPIVGTRRTNDWYSLYRSLVLALPINGTIRYCVVMFVRMSHYLASFAKCGIVRKAFGLVE